MKLFKNDIVKQFEGYFYAYNLWHGTLHNLHQFETTTLNCPKFNNQINSELRLGKRVERFFSYELSLDDSISILSENHQIIDNKITLGELDFIIKKNGKPIHIEVVYKFYLVDFSVGTNEIEHCVGPNKRDNLSKKLTKLKEKQLPLLYAPQTKPLLDNLGIAPETIRQNVFFKAELFLPLNMSFSFSILNNNCISGYYITYKQLNIFRDCKFYIPSKFNWIQNPDLKTNWINYLNFKFKIFDYLNKQISPLFWVKNPNGTKQKLFIIWWK